jgi:hypothetical protein
MSSLTSIGRYSPLIPPIGGGRGAYFLMDTPLGLGGSLSGSMSSQNLQATAAQPMKSTTARNGPPLFGGAAGVANQNLLGTVPRQFCYLGDALLCRYLMIKYVSPFLVFTGECGIVSLRPRHTFFFFVNPIFRSLHCPLSLSPCDVKENFYICTYYLYKPIYIYVYKHIYIYVKCAK